MTNRIGLGINFSQLPNTVLQSFKNLDWKVKACFAAALVLIVAGTGVFAMSRRSLTNRTATHPLKTITVDRLGFTPEELKRVHSMQTVTASAFQNWKFADVCTEFLNAINSELKAPPNANTITIDDISGVVLKFMDFGLPNNTFYTENMPQKEKEQSWGHIFLQRLVDMKLITNFNIKSAVKQDLHQFSEKRTLVIHLKK